MSESLASLSDSASPPEELPTVEERPYHSKRPHKKSRTGCKNCKARKVKCDEARPTCRSCRLRKTECIYPPPPPAATSSTKTSSSSSSTDTAEFDFSASESPSSQTAALFPASSSSLPFAASLRHSMAAPPDTSTDVTVISEPMFRPAIANDEFDMRLLWFYTTATCSSFSVECGYHRPVETVMRTRIVQHAFQTPFLMQSLFALTSLHLQNLSQRVDPNRSLAYRATSFEGYRKAVEEANPETTPALIANSLLLTALSSQTFREPDGKDLYIVDWMIVWRGIGLMINFMGVEKLVEAGLDSLFYRPPLDLELSTYSIPNQLLFMVSSIPTDDIDYPDTQTYYDTLKYIGALYYNLNKGLNPIMNLRIVTWLTFIPCHFVELSRQQRPRALVILAYYAMFLKVANSIWWVKGIGQRTLRDICRHLGPDWSSFLKVPMLAISTDDPFELARIVLEDPDWKSPSWPEPEDETLNEAIRDLSWVDNHGRKCEVRGSEVVVVEGDHAGHPIVEWAP